MYFTLTSITKLLNITGDWLINNIRYTWVWLIGLASDIRLIISFPFFINHLTLHIPKLAYKDCLRSFTMKSVHFILSLFKSIWLLGVFFPLNHSQNQQSSHMQLRCVF